MGRGSNKTQRVPNVQQASLLTVAESPSQRLLPEALWASLVNRGEAA